MQSVAVSNMLEAIDLLERALEANRGAGDEILSRIRWLRDEIGSETSLSDIVKGEARPLVVEQISEAIARLHTASSAFRHAEAQALYAEGLTMEQIADLFGVTRQRISVLLNTQSG